MTWAIYWLDGVSLPATHWLRGKPDSFTRAVDHYQRERGRFPETAGELREYASNEEEFETFRERFVWCAPRPVFVRFRLGSRGHYVGTDARWPKVILISEGDEGKESASAERAVGE